MFDGINWLAVLVSAVIYFVLGALWYSPLLFANIFMRYRGLTREDMQSQSGGGMRLDYLFPMLTGLIIAVVLAVLVNLANAVPLLDGVGVGVLAAVGFAATSTLTYTVFSGPHKGLWVIYTGYQLVGFAIMGALLALWQ
jgi:hypothetical protein